MSDRPADHDAPANLRIAQMLRIQIMRGDLAPGEILTHRKLAEQLNVSPMPVRDALRQLVAERALVVANGNRSVMVPHLDAARFADLRTIRCNMEGLAARLAAERWKPHHLEQLERIVSDSEEAGPPPDLARNQSFHFTLYAAAQSDVLLPLIESLWLQCGPYMRRARELVGLRLGTGDSHHREIIAALRQRDAEAARAAIVADISRAMALVAEDLRREQPVR